LNSGLFLFQRTRETFRRGSPIKKDMITASEIFPL